MITRSQGGEVFANYVEVQPGDGTRYAVFAVEIPDGQTVEGGATGTHMLVTVFSPWVNAYAMPKDDLMAYYVAEKLGPRGDRTMTDTAREALVEAVAEAMGEEVLG